jgi:hypothetical protein
MRRHPTAPADVAGSVATFGTDFTAPGAEFVTLVPVGWLLPGRSCGRQDRARTTSGGERTSGLFPALVADERHQCTSGCQASTATFNALARDLLHQRNRRSVLDAVPVAQHPTCSLSGTAFATPHSKIFGSCSENWGGGSSVFLQTYLNPVDRSAKMPAVFSFQESSTLLAKREKRDRVSESGLFRGRRSPPKASPRGGCSLMIEGRCQL